jgi:hypothetical protein
MTTTKITQYEMPLAIPYGSKNRLAKVLGVHPNTIYNIRTQGASHPLYGKMMKCLQEMYGTLSANASYPKNHENRFAYSNHRTDGRSLSL